MSDANKVSSFLLLLVVALFSLQTDVYAQSDSESDGGNPYAAIAIGITFVLLAVAGFFLYREYAKRKKIQDELKRFETIAADKEKVHAYDHQTIHELEKLFNKVPKDDQKTIDQIEDIYAKIKKKK